MGSFFKNSVMTTVTNVLLLFISVLTSVLIARFLGPDQRGVYALLTLVPTMLFTLLNLGINAGTVYHVSGKKFPLPTILGNNLLITGVLSALSFIIGGAVIYLGKNTFLAGTPVNLLLFSLIICPLSLFTQLFLSVLQGKEDFNKFNSSAIIKSLAFFAFCLLLFFSRQVAVVLLAFVLSQVVNAVQIYWWVFRGAGQLDLKPNKPYLKDALDYGIKAYISNLVTFFNYKIDQVLINYFMNTQAVGYYAVAVALAEQVWLISRSVSTVILPRISALESEVERKKLTTQTTRIVTAITFFGILALFLLSGWAIPLLYSKSYLQAVAPLKVLLIGIFTLGVTRVLSNDLAARGVPEYNTISGIAALITNVVLNLVLIPLIGITGSAWASAISYTVQSVMTLYYYWKITGNGLREILLLNREDISLLMKVVARYTKGSRE